MGAGRIALHARSFIDISLGDDQLIDIHIVRFVFRVRNRRAQHLLHHRRHALIDGAQDINRRPGLLAADHIHHQPRFLRRRSNVSSFCLAMNLPRFAQSIGGGRWVMGNPQPTPHNLHPFRMVSPSSPSRCLHRMSSKLPRRRKFAQLPAHHVLGHINRDKFSAVVDRQCMPNELRRNGGTPRPGPHHLLLALLVHRRHLLRQMVISKRSFF